LGVLGGGFFGFGLGFLVVGLGVFFWRLFRRGPLSKFRQGGRGLQEGTESADGKVGQGVVEVRITTQSFPPEKAARERRKSATVGKGNARVPA